MKLLPLLFACFISFMANAQNNRDCIQQSRQKLSELKKTQHVPTTIVRKDTARQLSNFALLLKPGVHHLPQDNMPCLVPDPNATVAIPNAWRGETKVPYTGKPPRIPNAAKPLAPPRPLIITPPDAK
jgi:hypothetical protein